MNLCMAFVTKKTAYRNNTAEGKWGHGKIPMPTTINITRMLNAYA
jgi:hypothetical protein